MRIAVYTFNALTDASGDYSSDAIPIDGFLLRISYKPSGSPLDTGADLTLVESATGLTIYTQANIGTTAYTKLPRRLIASTADGADSTTTFDLLPVNDKLTLTIANGGNALSGTFYLYIGQNA